MEESTVAGHRRALRIAFNLDTGFLLAGRKMADIADIDSNKHATMINTYCFPVKLLHQNKNTLTQT